MGKLIVLFFRQDFHLLILYRLGRLLASHNQNQLAEILTYFQLRWFSCQLSPKAKIHRQVKFPHPIGIVIGDGCEVESRVRIFQHVTLGGKKTADPLNAIIKYPLIKSHATVFPQSMIIGGITIGEKAIVGAQSLVLKDVPPGCTAIGSPAVLIESQNNHLLNGK